MSLSVKTENIFIHLYFFPLFQSLLTVPFPSTTYLNLESFFFFLLCGGDSDSKAYCALRFAPLASTLAIQEDNYCSCNAHSPWVEVAIWGLLVSTEKLDARRQA